MGNGLAARGSFGASAHASMVLAPPVSQRLGLAGVACTSGIGSTFDLLPHVDSSRMGLAIGSAIKNPLLLEYLPSSRPVRPRWVTELDTSL